MPYDSTAPLDSVERAMLAVLQERGRITNAELAAAVGLSESPCFRRVKQLEARGILTGYGARLDQARLGLCVTAFVLVTLEKQPAAATERFHGQVRDEPHIVECHAMSGSHDYLMKVVARDIEHFSELCMERILKFDGVRNVESSFSLRPIKAPAPLPT